MSQFDIRLLGGPHVSLLCRSSKVSRYFQLHPWDWVIILAAIGFVLRLVAIGLVPLIPEEAYYWMYARHPSLSYFDHPPMVAWVVRLGTGLFGDTEFGVRFAGNVLMSAAVVLMYAYGRIWHGKRTSIASALLLLILPLYQWTGFINTMNSQLLFFWLLAMVGGSLALRRGNMLGWYLAGFGFGGALLSKYTGAFVGAGMFLSLVLHRPWRRHLLSPHPYLGALLGLVMFSPALVWNYENAWASFRFQFVDRAEAHPLKSFSTLTSTLNFILLQLVVVTPLFLVASVALLRRAFRNRRRVLRPSVVFSTCLALPLFIAMAWKSIRFDVHLDWTAPLYLSLFPLVVRQILARLRRERMSHAKPIWARSVAVAIIGCAGFVIGAYVYLMTLQPRVGRPEVFGPWRVLARVVERYEEQLEKQTGREPLVVGRGKYRLASELAFYRVKSEMPESSSGFTTSQWFIGGVEGLGYSYWIDRPKWIGRDCLYVSDKDDIEAAVRNRFDRVEFIDDPELRRQPGGLTYHIALCHGFKG